MSLLNFTVKEVDFLVPFCFPYMFKLPLGNIISHFNGVSFHCYTNDMQIQLSFKQENVSCLRSLMECLTTTEKWMTYNFL